MGAERELFRLGEVREGLRVDVRVTNDALVLRRSASRCIS